MTREPWEPTVDDIIRIHFYMYDRWLYDCPVCGHEQHEGMCTRTTWVEKKGIETAFPGDATRLR